LLRLICLALGFVGGMTVLLSLLAGLFVEAFLVRIGGIGHCLSTEAAYELADEWTGAADNLADDGGDEADLLVVGVQAWPL
jgi:hypothetical protein